MPTIQIGSFLISEPMTVFTDLLITVFAFWFANRIFKSANQKSDLSLKAWAVGFLAIGLGAFLGAFSHGLVQMVSEKTIGYAWALTLINIGVVSACVLLATALRYLTGFLKKVVMIFVFLKFLVYLVAIQRSQEFVIAIADYFPVLLVALVLSTYTFMKKKLNSEKYIAIGILTSILGALVQRSGFTLHMHFNHNDLYHVIQIVGLYFIYKGLILDDAKKATAS